MDIITYSSGTTLCLCEKKYELRYERGLRPKAEVGEALMVGSWMHTGLEAYVRTGCDAAIAAIDKLERETPAIGPDIFRIQQRAARVRAMVRVSAERWPVGDGFRLAEHVVTMPVVSPDGGRSRTFTYNGVVDNVDGSTLSDWKRVDDPDKFIHRTHMGYQTELYATALGEQGVAVDRAVFRLVCEPSIKFCNKDGGSARLYEERCIAWLREDASRLQEHEMYLDAGRMAEARYWLWSVCKRVMDNRKTGRWLRNEHACHTWNRLCEFAPICRLEASGNDPSWVADNEYERVDDPHPELSRGATVQSRAAAGCVPASGGVFSNSGNAAEGQDAANSLPRSV